MERFPFLHDFRVTSPREVRYNCIAWAAGKDNSWWWPHSDNYWPQKAPMNNKVTAFIVAFETLGYEPCVDGTFEDGFEKVAIYEMAAEVTHMARQLRSGRWTSKLGRWVDIEHSSPLELEGDAYGEVVRYMRRRVGT